MSELVRTFGRTKVLPYQFFAEGTFEVNRSVTEEFLRQASKTTYVEEDSQIFMQKVGAKTSACRDCRVGFTYRRKTYWTCGN